MLTGSDKVGQSVYFPASQPHLHQQHQQQQQLVYNDSQQPLSSIGSQWSNTVYPFNNFGQQQTIQTFKTKPPTGKSGGKSVSNFHLRTDSRVKEYENHPVSVRLNGDYEFPINSCQTGSGLCLSSSASSNRNNVYEVPYSHLFRSQFSPDEEWAVSQANQINQPNQLNQVAFIQKLRPQPLGGSASLSSHSIPLQSKTSSMQKNYQDYESCYD